MQGGASGGWGGEGLAGEAMTSASCGVGEVPRAIPGEEEMSYLFRKT